MSWQDLKILLFMLLMAIIMALMFLLMGVGSDPGGGNDCKQPIKVGGALVIGEVPCDDKDTGGQR